MKNMSLKSMSRLTWISFFSVNTLEIFLEIFYNLKKKTLKNEPYSLEILKKIKKIS